MKPEDWRILFHGHYGSESTLSDIEIILITRNMDEEWVLEAMLYADPELGEFY